MHLLCIVVHKNYWPAWTPPLRAGPHEAPTRSSDQAQYLPHERSRLGSLTEFNRLFQTRPRDRESRSRYCTFHNSTIFCPNGLKIVLGTQETIIYRFVMWNRDFDAFWKISYFWLENGRGRHRGAKGSGASSPAQKFGSLAGPFGSTAISKTCFQKIRVYIWLKTNVYFYLLALSIIRLLFLQC